MDVETEAPLQRIKGEVADGISGDNARPDIKARGICQAEQNVLFGVRVTIKITVSRCTFKTEKSLEIHEK